MSMDLVNKEITSFLHRPDPEVMSIKGDWGIGKTYTWERLLKENKGNIALRNYSYVSLFGIKSLDELKFCIFQNVVDRESIGVNASIDTFSKNALSLSKSLGRKTVRLLGNTPYTRGLSPTIEALSFFSLKKAIICIDDLERRPESLDLKEVLGLVSLLKEKKDCKVILLMNDGENRLDEYKIYREKIVDIELKFDPTPKECSEIAFSERGYYVDKIKIFSQRLEIRNIRIIKKSHWFVDKVIPLIEQYNDMVKHQAVHTIVLYSWCYYSFNESRSDIPSLEYVTSKSNFIIDKSQDNADEKRWNKLLRSYEYIKTDEFDLVLKGLVQNGYFNEVEFLKQAELLNGKMIADESENWLSNAWGLFRSSFKNNQEEVVNELYSSSIEAASYISPMNLDSVVNLFRDLGEHEKANDLIDNYIQKRMGAPKVFDLDDGFSNPFARDIKDDVLREKFRCAFVESVNNNRKSLSDTIIDGMRKKVWTSEDFVVLSSASENDYYDFLKSIDGQRVGNYLEHLNNIANQDKSHSIKMKLNKSLKRIGRESLINKIRVRNFGIEIDEGEES